jgi:DNA-binding beta-propeller fold protein YncE
MVKKFLASVFISVCTLVSATPIYAVALEYKRQFGTSEQFNFPFGVTVNNVGNVFVAEVGKNSIVNFNPNNFAGSFSSFGTQGNGSGQFSQPTGVAVDSSGNVYVADRGNNRVIAYNTISNTFSSFGTQGSGIGEFNSPYGIAVSNGLVYVGDTLNSRIVSFDPSNFTSSFSSFGSLGSGTGQFNTPFGIAIDDNGMVYVADAGVFLNGANSRIATFDPNNFSATFTSFGSQGSGNGQFDNPQAVAVSNGIVYVSDLLNNRVVNFDPNNFSASFTSFGSQGSGNGQFNNSFGIAVDGSGNVFVSDASNFRIQELSPVTPVPFEFSPALGVGILGGAWQLRKVLKQKFTKS